MNLYREGDLTHYNKKLLNCVLRDLWAQCKQQSNYEDRKADVNAFNR